MNSTPKRSSRICIYTNDIQLITGKSERQSRNVIREIKVLHKKEKHQLVTIEEFCNYMGLDAETVRGLIK